MSKLSEEFLRDEPVVAESGDITDDDYGFIFSSAGELKAAFVPEGDFNILPAVIIQLCELLEIDPLALTQQTLH